MIYIIVIYFKALISHTISWFPGSTTRSWVEDDLHSVAPWHVTMAMAWPWLAGKSPRNGGFIGKIIDFYGPSTVHFQEMSFSPIQVLYLLKGSVTGV